MRNVLVCDRFGQSEERRFEQPVKWNFGPQTDCVRLDEIAFRIVGFEHSQRSDRIINISGARSLLSTFAMILYEMFTKAICSVFSERT
jgi:hypothetical protein